MLSIWSSKQVVSRTDVPFDETWYAYSNFDQGNGNVTKIHKFANSKWRMNAALQITFWL